MKKISRRLGALLLMSATLGMVGCSGTAKTESVQQMGQLNLPLTTQGASGAKYRLRNATFVVQSNDYYYDEQNAAGAGGSNGATTVSSETDPNANNISLSLEEGSYYIQLQPGWSFEKDGPEGPEAVEATLLSGQTQWVYVQRQSTTWAEFDFGIGSKELWLNGKVNIAINVQETPGENNGGAGGWVNTVGGWTSAGAPAVPAGGVGGSF